jgi:4-aminobutyrate aminotransferase
MEFICRKPGKKSVAVLKRDAKIVSPSMTREQSIVVDRAKGCYIWDLDKHKYLDFAAGVGVANVGHTNIDVINAIKKQTHKAIHCAFADFNSEVPVNFIEELLKHLPKHLNTAFLSNSGTEAVECAYKCARWHTNKKWTIAFTPCFHGRTMGSLSMTNARPVQRARYEPFLPVKHAPYANTYHFDGSEDECVTASLSSLETEMKSCTNDISAVFLEPIAGEPGYIVPPKEWVKGIRKLCDEYNALLVSDEVQAGCYRTGKFLAIHNFGVQPDIVSLSKAIGAGVPLGATVANKKIMNWPPGAHANTFGGNLLACAGGLASLKYMREKKLGANALKRGKQIMKRLNEMKEEYEIIGDVRGIGLMIGIEFVNNKEEKKSAFNERDAVLCAALERGLLLLGAGTATTSVIRFCPPLIITKAQADHALNVFESAVKKVSKKY